MWPKPKKKGKTKNKLNAFEPEKIPDGPEQIELLRKNSGSNSGVHQGREANAQPREDISGVWKASLMKAIAPGTPIQVSTDSIPKMKIPVNRDVLEAQEKQRRQTIFQAVIRIIDRMFDNFQNTAYGFNQVASGSDLELTWMRPQVREENMAAWHEGRSRLCQIFSGRISTRFWTMLVRGTDEGIGVYIMPADKVLSFTPEDKNFLCYLTMSPNFDTERNLISFLANGLPVAEDLYPSIFRALLDALIRYANEEATPGEVFDFGEIGIVPEAPPPPKEVKETSVSSSFNAEVPRTSYADAVQQIQAHNKAGHVDQLISTSTNARPVDPNEFIRSNSSNFPGLQTGQAGQTPANSSDEWKGFSSTSNQKQFQTGSQPALQSQSGNWRTSQGQPVPEPVNPALNAPNSSDGSGAWNFIPNTEIQSHQRNSGNQPIPQNPQFQQTQPIPQFQQPPQPSQPYRHPLEQQTPPQPLMSHPTADSGMISEFTLPDFQRPSRAELEQLRQDARPPINQSQEIAGVAPVFKLPEESPAPALEQEQFELLSENPPEMSGDFAPITVANYETLESDESTENTEVAEFSQESEIDEFDAISESSDEQSEEEVEEVEQFDQEEQLEHSDDQAHLAEDAIDSEEDFDSGEAASEDLEQIEPAEEVEDSLEEPEHSIEEEHEEDSVESENIETEAKDVEEENFDDNQSIEDEIEELEPVQETSDDEEDDDVQVDEDAEANLETDEAEAEEIEEEVESVEAIEEVEEEDEEDEDEVEVEEEDDEDEDDDDDEEDAALEDSDDDDSEESEEIEEDDDESESAEVSENEEIEEDPVIDDSSDSVEDSQIEAETSIAPSDSDDENTESESKDSEIEEKAQDSPKTESTKSTSSESSSNIGSGSSVADDKVMPAFSKFPSLSVVEITLGKCPDLSDALSVLLPVLDAQIDELAAQGGKAFTTKDFKRAEAIIKLTEKLEDFKTEASAILNLIDDDEDEKD